MSTDDDIAIDFYRIVRFSGLIVLGWVMQLVGLSEFQDRVRSGPPPVRVLDFESATVSEGSNPPKPIAEYAAESKSGLQGHFVSKDKAAEVLREHERKKWGGLAAGICGMLLVMRFAWLLWGRWTVVIATILFGPAMVAAMQYRGKR
jgi:hypothetical protein